MTIQELTPALFDKFVKFSLRRPDGVNTQGEVTFSSFFKIHQEIALVDDGSGVWTFFRTGIRGFVPTQDGLCELVEE